MRLEDAKLEVLERVSKVCGYTVSENELSPTARQSINSLATVFRQLIMTKQLLMVEQTSYNTRGSRMKRVITRSKDEGMRKHIMQVEAIQKDLNSKIQEAAEKIAQELKTKWEAYQSGLQSGTPMISHVIIEQLKCKNCGANLSTPSSTITKCSYCGAEYALSEYLEQVGSLIRQE